MVLQIETDCPTCQTHISFFMKVDEISPGAHEVRFELGHPRECPKCALPLVPDEDIIQLIMDALTGTSGKVISLGQN